MAQRENRGIGFFRLLRRLSRSRGSFRRSLSRQAVSRGPASSVAPGWRIGPALNSIGGSGMTQVVYFRAGLILSVAALPILLTLGGCVGEKREVPEAPLPALVQVPPESLPQFTDDLDFGGLSQGIGQSLSYLGKLPPERGFRFGSSEVTATDMIRGLTTFRKFIASGPSSSALNRFVRNHFEVYRAAGSAETGEVLFTGYYEPLLEGRVSPDALYRYPIYGRPRDLAVLDLTPFGKQFEGVKLTGRYTQPDFVPYYDRRTIETSPVLADKAPVLAWVKDPVDLFFLHIQGSGQIQISSQETLHVHYAAANGRPYRSIGRLLIDTGKVPKEEMSMQAIRAYLAAHPNQLDAVLHHNPSYVFFQREPNGPLGAINVVLTPGRSLAVDRGLFPLAGLCFARLPIPLTDGNGRIIEWQPVSRFVLPQDTGGAIKGAGRADLFWGSGDYAALAAGHMQHPGELYFLAPSPLE